MLAANQERASDLQPRRSQRERNPELTGSANAERAMVAHVAEPQTVELALDGDEKDQWYDA